MSDLLKTQQGYTKLLAVSSEDERLMLTSGNSCSYEKKCWVSGESGKVETKDGQISGYPPFSHGVRRSVSETIAKQSEADPRGRPVCA